MQIEYQSDVGRRRNTNQDYASVFTNQAGIKLAVLADGMGGHRAGDIASQMAVTNLGTAWENLSLSDDEKVAQWFIKTIQEENTRIYQRGQEQPEYNGMGTTIVAAALSEDQFTIAHVGDSRAYLIREDKIIQLTEDHSLVNELVKSGEIRNGSEPPTKKYFNSFCRNARNCRSRCIDLYLAIKRSFVVVFGWVNEHVI